MQDAIYTLGAWQVKDGRQVEFVAAWTALGDVFRALPRPPAGAGVLVQSTRDPLLFYSFGPWRSAGDVEAMRADPDARAAIQRLVDLCDSASPGTFRVAAVSPP
jgi:hypothetical protein